MSTRGGTLHAPAEVRAEQPHAEPGRLPLVVYGDRRPHTVTIAAAAGAALLLLAIVPLAGSAPATVVLVALLGLFGLFSLFGLGGDPVLMALAVHYAGEAPTLASALTVSAFNLGTAVGSGIAGRALDSGLGSTGPAVVGAAIAALTLVPTGVLALDRRCRAVASGPADLPDAPADRADQA